MIITTLPFYRNSNLTSGLWEEMERVFDDTKVQPFSYSENSWGSACEILENDDAYFLSLDVPGIKKEDLKIEIVDKVLTISGERKKENRTDNKLKVHHYEKAYGSFKRSFTLNVALDEKSVQARCENGVLELYLPKAAAAKPRRIEINEGRVLGLFDKLLGHKDTSEASNRSAQVE
jgi:HSP20 family protein